MSRKVIPNLIICTALIFGTVLSVNASSGKNELLAADSWSVSSYPSGDSSDTASDIRGGGSSIAVFTYNYSSQPSGSQPVYATSAQSPDRLGINSTTLRFMSYSGGLPSNARIDVNFYAYSSSDRIIANGSIDAN